MTYVISLEDYTPTARTDGLPWTHFDLYEFTTAEAPWVDATPIQTFVLSPVDPDPANPQPRSFTTTLATLEQGWYRGVWRDAAGREQPTLPVRRVVWAPSVEDVAAVTQAYTRVGMTAVGTYTANTSPTHDEVEDLIAAACDEIIGRVGVEIPVRCFGLARTTAKWHVAAAIAASKHPEQVEDQTGEYRYLITNFRHCLDSLIELSRRAELRLV